MQYSQRLWSTCFTYCRLKCTIQLILFYYIYTSHPLFTGERTVGTLFHRMCHRGNHGACCLLVQLLSGLLHTQVMVSICCSIAVEEFCTLCTAACPDLTAALCVCEGNTGIYCACVCGSIFLYNAWRRSMVPSQTLLASVFSAKSLEL